MKNNVKLSPNVIKIISNSNCYVVEGRIIIDTSGPGLKDRIQDSLLDFGINPGSIKKVILTHMHYDHIANLDLFHDSKIYASTHALSLLSDPHLKAMLILNQSIAEKLNAPIKDIAKDSELNDMFEIIPTPGHCKTSICLYYKKDNILFTGDTFFSEDCTGRTDLPLSQPEFMESSLEKVRKIIKKHSPIIASGHDY
jgi:hydroxyacylglutathione hydrolase